MYRVMMINNRREIHVHGTYDTQWMAAAIRRNISTMVRAAWIVQVSA